jgi:methylenetetrahydrofolate dehydrogenase (NADP+) / methenyltetrahydrofolate cyclohydrolase
MNIVDGRALALQIKNKIAHEVAGLSSAPTLAIVACDPNFETQKYLELKQGIAKTLGIKIQTGILPSESTTESIIEAVASAAQDSDGVIVQLPLPTHIDTVRVLASIPNGKDVDAFSYRGEETSILPPVVGAIDYISKQYQLDWQDKQVVIFGSGRLVGAPTLHYAKGKGVRVEVINAKTSNEDIIRLTKQADIIVLGVGQQNLLLLDMVKEGVVVFDAGASEDGGVLVGDAHKDVANKASIFTPVPGGIGPLTIAILFSNLLKLQSRQ